MAQRESGYVRQAHDAYWTPQWVYDALYLVEPILKGSNDIAPRNAEQLGYDFLAQTGIFGSIATNPPFSKSDAFVRHALALTKFQECAVGMLLPVTWDTAKKRIDLFTESPFKSKYILTRRIRWENLEQKKNGPSTNHAWYVWDHAYSGVPTIGWLEG